MTVQRFISENQPSWDRLAEFLQILATRRLQETPPDRLREYSRLYRKAVSDLAYARVNSPSHPVVRQLEVLVGRAHSLMFRSRRSDAGSWLRFFTDDFPALFRSTFGYTATATAILALFWVAGYLVTLQDPEFAGHLLSPELLATVDRGELWTGEINSIRPMAQSAIATNNITVTFTAFASGITFGVGTVYLLALNGLLLGAALGITWIHGLGGDLLAFMLPHGVIELPVICIAAGAGLLVARALLLPGRYRRRFEVQRAARTGAELVLGCVPLLLIAGTIEAWISPSHLPFAVRMGVAALGALGMAWYLRSGSAASGPGTSARPAWRAPGPGSPPPRRPAR